MGGERACGEQVAELRRRVGALTGDERLPLTVRVALRICQKPSVGMKRGRDYCLLSRIIIRLTRKLAEGAQILQINTAK